MGESINVIHVIDKFPFSATTEIKEIMLFTLHYRFTEDIYQMTGYRPGIYWQMTWRYIGPAIMVCILISSIIFMIIRNPTYGAWSKELVSFIFMTVMCNVNVYHHFRAPWFRLNILIG